MAKNLLSIENMTIEQKVGMVMCARRYATDDDMDFTIELIRNHALGCVQLPAHRKDIVEKILAAADYPILVFNDAETGFPTTELPQIPLMSLAACSDPEYYRAFARGVVRDAQAAGFNGNWGPVIDVLHCDGPCRVYRHFSDDPMQVAKAAEEIARVYRQNHYLSTGKHYPGAHDCPFDTHMTEGYTDISEKELIEFDLAPYKYLLEKDLLPCIMTGHTIIRSIDPDYPASLSKKVIDIIRNMGFDGVCFTDSFAMMGILQKYGEDNVYGMAVAAGNDIILPNYRTSTRENYGRLLKNFRDGVYSEERLNEAVRRVLAAQAFVAEEAECPTPFTAADEALLGCIARDCVTAVTDEGVSAKLPESDSRLFIILTENNYAPENPNPEVSTSPWYHPENIARKIKEEFPGAGVEFLPEFPAARDNDRVLVAATQYKEVVFVTFCNTQPYMGTDCLTRRAEAVVNCLIHSGKISAVVHFGNPFAMKMIHHVPRMIFGYMIPASQEYAIEALSGKSEPKGRLPFRVELN